MLRKSLWGQAAGPRPDIADLSNRELVVLIPLCLGVFWLGLHPGPALEIIGTALAGLNTAKGLLTLAP